MEEVKRESPMPCHKTYQGKIIAQITILQIDCEIIG